MFCEVSCCTAQVVCIAMSAEAVFVMYALYCGKTMGVVCDYSNNDMSCHRYCDSIVHWCSGR